MFYSQVEINCHQAGDEFEEHVDCTRHNQPECGVSGICIFFVKYSQNFGENFHNI